MTFRIATTFSALRPRRAVLFGTGVGFGMAAAVAAVMAASGVRAPGGPDPRPELRPEPVASLWRESPARIMAFDIDAPRWRGLGLATQSLRRADGLSRETFIFGRPDDDSRFAAVAVDRGDAESRPAEDELAALANDLAIPARVAAHDGGLDTKFGTLAVADMAIDGPSGPKACLGFAFRATEARLRINGFACNAGPHIVDRREVACLLDRLVTIGAGDGQINAIFSAAELRRSACEAIQAGMVGGRVAHFLDRDGPLQLRMAPAR